MRGKNSLSHKMVVVLLLVVGAGGIILSSIQIQSTDRLGLFPLPLTFPGSSSGFTTAHPGTFQVNISGTNFDIYSLNEENYERQQKNESFSYIDSLTRFNANSSIFLSDHLESGTYHVEIEAHDNTTVTLYQYDIVYDNGGLPLSSVQIASIFIFVGVTIIMVYLAIKVRKKQN